ncbi:lipid phosphate phosphatase gamma, partial [Olea europaea var. sylvestris]|uniref:lipid phosphate phosphatase gamma n=1 Tax=Olea europaea var. sylvestris TaxID=158386 RepID=UPI000C1D6FF4
QLHFLNFPKSFQENRSNSHAHPPLKAVTLTHVRYQRGDQLGHFLAWISLVPVFISLGGFVSHFIFRRELQGMFFALGLLISQFINEIIKTSVQQARPETCALLEMCDSHGWPSSHSQYMFFFAVYFTLLTYYKIGILARKQLWVVGLLVWPLAIFTMYSRVYLGYHTVAQVIAGAALGAVLGGGWFWVVNYLLRGYFPTIEESAFGRFFYVKDTSHIPNVLKFEYENARAARKHVSYKRSS